MSMSDVNAQANRTKINNTRYLIEFPYAAGEDTLSFKMFHPLLLFF
jgi:hypothetical protein